MEFNATFIVSAISFIAFTIIMNAILYEPLQKIVEKRKKFIEDNYTDAENASNKSDSILKDKEEKLNKSRLEAKGIMSAKTDEANLKKEELTKSAKEKTISDVNVAKEELYKSKDNVETSLSNEVLNIAQMISDKILGENVPINPEEALNV